MAPRFRERGPLRLKDLFLLPLGGFLVAVGIVGFLLPLLPGFPFFLAGLALLGARIPSLRRRLEDYKWRIKRRRFGRRSGGGSPPPQG